MPAAATAQRSFQIRCGDSAAGLVHAGVPVLAGEAVESIFPQARPAGRSGAYQLFEFGRWLIGAGSMPVAGIYADASARLYAELFAAAGNHSLCRIWNYLPRINAPGSDGLENYRSFSLGRSLAFEQRFGSAYKSRLPAGSAVGCDADVLSVVFAAHDSEPRHFENPDQVPAYDYPAVHGPRPPSFCRATVLISEAGRNVFVSGTAAVRGHQSVAVGDTRKQLALTLQNLSRIFAVAGLGADLRGVRAASRHFKIYLRRAGDLDEVAGVLDKEMIRSGDRVSYLRADLCRAELDVEIEATILGAESAAESSS